MILETIGRDCLFLNWALPAEALPELAAPLRYDVHARGEDDCVFLSAALFRQQVIDIPNVLFPKVSYPQLTVRLCTLDAEGVPSFFISTVMLPGWVVPSVRLVAGQRARKAKFDYPTQGSNLEASPLRWSVESEGLLDVSVTSGAAASGAGPTLGDWGQTVAYFQRRKRLYFHTSSGLKRIEVTSRHEQAIPVASRVADDSLFGSCLAGCADLCWPRLHSSWLSPEIPFVFEIGWAQERRLPSQVPAPG